MPPKKDIVKESQPKAVKLNTETDLNTIGKQSILTSSDAPGIESDTKSESGKKTTIFKPPGMENTVVKQIEILQPFITEAEVVKIGIAKWHEYRGNPEIFTTVINGRRFKMYRSEFMKAKDRGLVLQDG